jgi:hypothetical protein
MSQTSHNRSFPYIAEGAHYCIEYYKSLLVVAALRAAVPVIVKNEAVAVSTSPALSWC